jgi:hypothetical protein
MDRAHGRAPGGVRVDGTVPHGRWEMITPTAAVRLGGVGACPALDGATDSAVFETDVGECLAPTPGPGGIAVMDDLPRHETAEVARLIAEVRYLPAYSPDLDPIERPFSELKAWLRSAAARTVDGRIEAMGQALRAVRPGDIPGWFGQSGYGGGPSTGTLNRKLL